MNKNSVQYVNIVKNQQNIKVDYQVIEKNNIIKTEQSVFLLNEANLSNDTLFKLKSLEDTIAQTYINGICESTNQTIVSKDTQLDQNQTAITFDANHNIVLQNNEINNSKMFYNNGKLDYLISPFSLLQNIMTESLTPNSLNLLILNDTIYAIVLDKDQRYIHSNIATLTPYDEIKSSEFYNDEIVEQKLFDEIYLLELTDNISNITKEFYEKEENSNFIETINIYYVINQLNEEQIESLQETLMMNINYLPISINDHLYVIAKKQNAQSYSFITPRKKQTGLSLTLWIIIAILSTILTAGMIYLLQDDEKEEQVPVKTQKIEKKKEQKKVVKSESVKLVDHNNSNTHTTELIKTIFDLIDDQSILKEIQLQKQESTIIYNYKEQFSYETKLKPELLKIYKSSENILTSESKNLYTTIVSNTALVNKFKPNKIKYTSKDIKHLDKTASINLLKSFFNDKTTVKHLSDIQTKYMKSIYQIETIIKEPIEFFDAISVINKQPYSMVVSYPIEFSKSAKGIEVKFKITINQNNLN